MTFARTQLRRVARILNGGTPPSASAELWDGGVPFVTPPDLNGLHGAPIMSTSRTITVDGVAFSGLAPVGSVLLSTRAPIGHIGRLVTPAAFNQGCRALVPAPGHEPRFLAYALVEARADMGARGLGTTFVELSSSSLAEVAIPLVPRDRQRAIADYLDRETAQIDAFIAKNEELIALLTERRNSVWSDLYMEAASTVRLAPLRRFVSSITDGPFGSSLTSAHYSDAGTRVIRLGNIGINEFKAGDEAFISDDYAATLTAHAALPGDVIVAGLGDDRMPLGRACVLPDIGPAIVKADCYRVRPTHSVSPAFLAWVLSAPPTRGLMKLAARGSTRERLNTSVVLDIEVPIPEADVQTDLVKRFATSAATIDEARGVAERGVSLARERRAALISAAVTGMIDVGVAT